METVEKTKTENPAPPYEAPKLGAPESVASVTLFSGTIDPDAGVVGFGGG